MSSQVPVLIDGNNSCAYGIGGHGYVYISYPDSSYGRAVSQRAGERKPHYAGNILKGIQRHLQFRIRRQRQYAQRSQCVGIRQYILKEEIERCSIELQVLCSTAADDSNYKCAG